LLTFKPSWLYPVVSSPIPFGLKQVFRSPPTKNESEANFFVNFYESNPFTKLRGIS